MFSVYTLRGHENDRNVADPSAFRSDLRNRVYSLFYGPDLPNIRLHQGNSSSPLLEEAWRADCRVFPPQVDPRDTVMPKGANAWLTKVRVSLADRVAFGGITI